MLIGINRVPGLFTEKKLFALCTAIVPPDYFPLSNPTSRVEATKTFCIDFRSSIESPPGSPFEPVVVDGETFEIAQCNNGFIFPLTGVLAPRCRHVPDATLMASSRALAECSPLAIDGSGPLLPKLEDIHAVSKHIAFAVGKVAVEQG